ncbi:trypsin-like peptidase domain-containing protein [Rhabdochromatium marinum]|uniref:trypsin-like peptidase domain-containing protein n=1 Tax=Rhabdochromatium marinum TaxID=48729 RepID=UPI0019082E7F|nr:trypsin-like peptidase domain-containing protein [Rhabdochromatium marinum]MBK1647297.1 hypothetical protein [Rhabdochromatium marinum]
MDEHEKNLLVEIFVSAGERESSLTGYPIAPGRILTARHGLLPDVASKARRIEVRWHEQTDPASRRWRRACVVWESEPLDAAVLMCRFPAGLRDRFGLPSDEPLDDTRRWSGAGIAAAGDQGPTATGSYDFQGRVYSAASRKTRFSLGIDDACDRHAWYEGASGMPVFIDHRLVGIAVARDPAAPTRRFEASPMRHMLADADFRRVIGHDARLARRDAALDVLTQALRATRAHALCPKLRDALGGASANPEKLAEALLDCPLEGVLGALDQTLEELPQDLAQPARETVAMILSELLPAIYDPSAMAGTAQRGAQPGAWCLDLPAGLRTAGEIIMAGLRARPAHFKPLPDRHSFPEPRDLLPSAPDEGFDSDGQALAQNLEDDLANLLGVGRIQAVESFLGRTFRPEREALVKSDRDRTAVRGMVRRELQTRATRERRSYYFLLDPAAVPAHGEAIASIKTLKEHYPELDFAMLIYAQDLDILGREEARFLPLRYLLPCLQEALP